MTELSDATLYTFAIRSVCSEDMVSPWAATTFTTLTEPLSIPFSTTFSDSVQWFTIDNAIGANAWSFGSATSADPNGRSAYISNDGGNTYAADLTTSNTIAFLWQDIDFGETENAFELSFDEGRRQVISSAGNMVKYRYLGMLSGPVFKSDLWAVEFLRNSKDGKAVVQEILFKLTSAADDGKFQVVSFGFML